MGDFSLHLNLTQDIGHGVAFMFVCCIAILFAVLIDLSTGVERARKCKERIKSRILRRTVSKLIDYYRLLFFGIIIDVLGLIFTWYNNPYCTVLIALGVVAVEAKSVLENYRNMKSVARDVPNAMGDIADVMISDKAKELIDIIKDNDNDTKRIEK